VRGLRRQIIEDIKVLLLIIKLIKLAKKRQRRGEKVEIFIDILRPLKISEIT